MDEPLVSIGMPVYNGQAYVREAIESLLAQTHHSIELIVSDNASTDDTPAIVTALARGDNRIRYCRGEVNRGVVWNFRHVLHLASGEYFMWASHDDRWLARFIEANLLAIQNDDRRIASMSRVRAITSPPYVTADTYPLVGEPADNVRDYLRHPGGNCRMYGLFRRESLLQSVGEEVLWAFDWLWMVRALRYGHFHEVPEVLMERRLGGESHDKAAAVRRYNPMLVGRLFPKWPLTRCLWAEPHVRKTPAILTWMLRENVKDAAVAFYDWLYGVLPPLRPILALIRHKTRQRW